MVGLGYDKCDTSAPGCDEYFYHQFAGNFEKAAAEHGGQS